MTDFSERQLIIGLITSTDFIKRIQNKWSVKLIESNTARRIASWCIEYFNKYNKAPGRDIQGIFYDKLRNGLPKEIGEEIEEDILPSLSNEFENTSINVDYLVDDAIKYFNERHLILHQEKIKALVDQGKLVEAEKEALTYKSISKDSGSWIDLSNEDVLERVDRAFNETNECLINFPGPLGEFWNDQMVRDGFVALMASEKRGKTFWLLEFAMRAAKQGRKVAFFQAGDMTESQQLKRISVYLTKKSNLKKYSGEMLEPVKDCIWNQLNKCKKKERECDYGIFEGKSEKFVRSEVTLNDIEQAIENNPDYVNCHNCKEFEYNRWGCSWMKSVDTGDPLSNEEAKKAIKEFFIKYKRQFKLSTHANGTLTVRQAKVVLDIWKKEGFIPDVIIFDYPDIMDDEIVKEFRHKQNAIWMGLRGLSQEQHALVIAVTQADAESYTKDTLGSQNFSEDKRKFAHPTGFYGLNQDHKGREKKLQIMRINEIAIREGEFDQNHQVYVLQNLRRGRPFLTSYW